MRFDLQVIASWIEKDAKVLDLGCGEGDLMVHLRDERQAKCVGIEQSEAKVARCIKRGLSVLQGDLNQEVLDYPDQAFDYTILSQTLQQVYKPDWLIKQMLRIGRRGIVSFPNFGHLPIRGQLLLKGHAPVSSALPFQWYDTPNIRVLTLRDFRRFGREAGFKVLKEVAINTDHHQNTGNIIRLWPNLRASYGIFLIGEI